jgi:hypothetical protein
MVDASGSPEFRSGKLSMKEVLDKFTSMFTEVVANDGSISAEDIQCFLTDYAG